jgi:hypothetical protein
MLKREGTNEAISTASIDVIGANRKCHALAPALPPSPPASPYTGANTYTAGANPAASSSPPAAHSPNVPPFSPSLAAGDEAPKWMLFSPSSLEGRSLASGRFYGPPSTPSFADVVRERGRSPTVGRGRIPATPRARCPWSRAPPPSANRTALVVRRQQLHG